MKRKYSLKPKPYHMLYIYRSGKWEAEFGSYVRSEVTFEARMYIESLANNIKRKDIRVITLPDGSQDTINRYKQHLNSTDTRIL